ncbi:MAG: bifunctional phosphoribosylaminoimidazolecarboxamide formyltransferase/inosine monophosphate cyclohydrolase [Candidatus Pelagibacter sp.]|nr:bifunctional phosphoribosylaminoimidazolecarboxamide formyltransferase/inosine monophosphate cyclohydrolase [Candidatus Pelagibacter sp.]
MLKKIKNALISVSDKEDLLDILETLSKFEVNIISSGGTYKKINSLGFNCTEISKYTRFKEMLDGRVKTLHPKIHAGILHDRSKKTHLNQMKKNKFPAIDLIIVNFYPFQKIVSESKNEKKIINNIDVGGPTMVRAAAKNFKNVTIITSKQDYGKFCNELLKFRGSVSLEFRELMASKAFSLTAYYDSLISNWINKKLKIKFPDRITIFGRKFEDLRYGENPHQNAAIYINDFSDKTLKLKKISGKKLSYNNYNDMVTAIEIVRSFKKLPTSAIIKHANPCGVASNKSSLKSYKDALSSDPVSSFGGILATNYKINEVIAKEIIKNYFEVVVANQFEKSALKILKTKKNMRIIDSSKYLLKDTMDIKFFDGQFLIQDKDDQNFDKEKFKILPKKRINKKFFEELLFASTVAKFVKSNAIVITKGLMTLGIGAGQPSRLDSCKLAVQKSKKFHGKKIKGSIAASDAFFPFADGLKQLTKSGVKTIIQPGGSIRDNEVIKSAKNSKVSMILTGVRHFKH